MSDPPVGHGSGPDRLNDELDDDAYEPDDDYDDEFDEDDAEGPGDGQRTVFTYDASVAPDEPAMVGLLTHGEIAVLGRMPWSSNGTFLVDVTLD